MISRTLMAAAAWALCATAASAADLWQVWQAARQHDPQGAVSLASRAAGATRHDQAAALWRPTLGLSASAGWANAQSQMNGAQFSALNSGMTDRANFATSVNGGTVTRWALNAQQPLYNLERRAQSAQLSIAAQASEHEWQMAQQDWMLQTAQRYFDVVQAERRLALVQQQQQAVDKALTEAKERFALGDAPVTDTHEAQARAQAEAAQQDIEKHRAVASPTLDLVAQASHDRISGSGDFGSARNTQSQQMVGVVLNVPIYTGGWRSAKLQEAIHLHAKARTELERTRLQVVQMTRAAWLALASGQAHLAALAAARIASQARLASTQLGRQVGDRTTLDLLNAQNDASAAELAWLQGQMDTLMAQLRLHAMAGQLGDALLQTVNSALAN